MKGQPNCPGVRAEGPQVDHGSRQRSGSHSRTEGRKWSILYAIATLALTTAVAAYSPGMRHALHNSSSDIWQHLAAINAIAEHPFHPTNPFVASSSPSRLFGPLWVTIGTVCSLFNLSALDGFWIGGIINLALLFTGVWLLGTRLLDGPKGAIALLAAMLGGWVWPPNFTGYHSPLALLCSAGYPAITAVAASLILWGLSLEWLRGSAVGPWIAITAGLAFIVHPMGMAVGLSGCGLIAAFYNQFPLKRRLELVGLLVIGVLLSLAWPYFNPVDVLLSASEPSWGAGIDFYNPYWIAASLFPAIIGLPFLFRREMWPFLCLLGLCSIGFGLGATSYFVAGHRLLSWMALILQIGLAAAILMVFRSRSRVAVAAQAFAICLVLVQAVFTSLSLASMQREATQESDLLADARGLLRNSNGGFAGYLGATFPLTALGQRVLSTPFPEPLVGDMLQRQAGSKRLFEIEDRNTRIFAARSLGVRYLVAEKGAIPPVIATRLSRQSRSVVQSGNLLRFQLY